MRHLPSVAELSALVLLGSACSCAAEPNSTKADSSATPGAVFEPPAYQTLMQCLIGTSPPEAAIRAEQAMPEFIITTGSSSCSLTLHQ